MNGAYQLAVGDRVAKRGCDQEVLSAALCKSDNGNVRIVYCWIYPEDFAIGVVTQVDLPNGRVKVGDRWLGVREVCTYPDEEEVSRRAFMARQMLV